MILRDESSVFFRGRHGIRFHEYRFKEMGRSQAATSMSPRADAGSRSARQRQRLQPLEKKPAGSLLIHEIYRSLQGESTFAGLPCVFIRLTACNLRCSYCDTPHAFAEGQILDLDSVVTRALELGDDLVEITGGEPLLQPEVYPLMTSSRRRWQDGLT